VSGTADPGGTWPYEAPPEQPRPSALQPGHTLLERYTVLGTLGQGSMGMVLSAYDARLDRRVALKLMNPGLGGSGSTGEQSRFLHEAQAMARLNHPHVVAIYDAGTLEDGSLFIAMEHVEGQTLRSWQQQRPWREVLEKYLAAGRGLMAAHAAGLVHRDFKPDNVLVGQDGRARVTDFGLARAAEPAAPSSQLPEPLLTQPGQWGGTPFYMAPEQFQGQRADARSDLYAFCASLYEGLYGQVPFQGSTLEKLREAQRSGKAMPPEGSEVPAWLARTVLRGLHGEPSQRPASMAVLLAELEDDPEARRRVWRLRAGVAGVAALLAVAISWGLIRPQEQECGGMEQRLAGAWDEAVKARAEQALLATGVPYARATADRVGSELDTYARAWAQQRTELCLNSHREGHSQAQGLMLLEETCLERRRSQLRALTELFSQPVDRAFADKAVHAVQALPPLEYCSDAKALTAAVPPPENPAVRSKVEALQERVDRLEALLEAGKYQPGLAQAAALLPEVEAVGYLPLLARTLLLSSRLRSGAGDFPGAEEVLRKAMAAAAQGKDGAVLAQAWGDLLTLVGDSEGRYQEALVLRPAMENIVELADDDRIRAAALDSLGTALMGMGKYEDARQVFSRALELRLKTGPEENLDVASSINNLGAVFFYTGKYEEARDKYARALALREKILGPEHPRVARSLNNLGTALKELGRLEEARQVHARALALREKALGPEHPDVAGSLNNLSAVLEEMGRYEEARQAQARVLALWEKALGPEHPDVAIALSNLGVILGELGRHEESRQMNERALALQLKVLGPEHPDIAGTLGNLGDSLRELGRSAEAHKRYERALALQDKVLPPDHPDRAPILLGMGRLELDQHRPAQAVPLLEHALKLAPEVTRAQVQLFLAQALWEAGRERPRAVELATQAREQWSHQGRTAEAQHTTQWLEEHTGATGQASASQR
jgi:tetratricopeptide (TPR) repeat protein